MTPAPTLVPPLLFSDFFEVAAADLSTYGAFNISLVTDLPLFIDPFLLFNSKKDTYNQLHRRIIRYLAFLRNKSSNPALDPGLLDAWYTFHEVRQTWLGFSRDSNRGRGLGGKFARALFTNLHRLFPNFGNEGITRESHLEKLCLIENGVGRDSISDFTTNLIKEFLLDYTQEFAQQNIAVNKRRSFRISKVRFNYGTESWETDEYVLPVAGNDYVLLTPRDMLTRDDTWINKTDLLSEFQAIPDSISNVELRAQVNNYFRGLLSNEPTSRERRQAAAETIRHFPELVDYYIKSKEDHGEVAQSLSASEVRFSEQLFLRQFTQLSALLRDKSNFYQTRGNTCDEARERANYLKDVIENKGGHKLFYVGGKPIEREEDLHIAYKLTWFGTESDVTREANDGRGPADFKISRGRRDKAIVEFKLAKNSQLKKNLQHQTKIYEKASDADCSIKVIVFFDQAEQERLLRILKELDLIFDPNVIVIDARQDNKPSGSKAA